MNLRKSLVGLICLVTFCSVALSQGAGSLDTTFNPGSGEASPNTLCITVQTNEQVLVGGDFSSLSGDGVPFLARLNTDGSLDSTFGPAVPNGAVLALILQLDGKILVGGSFGTVNGLVMNGVARLRTDGSVDTGFSNGPPFSCNALVLQPDGEIIAGGGSLRRLNTNGVSEATFNFSGTVLALGLQSSGSIIVGGNFTTTNGTKFLARFNADGTLDNSFTPGVAGGSVNSLAVLAQDQIVIGGGFSSVNGYYRSGIARLNADGSVDTTFGPGLGPDGAVQSVAVDSNNRVTIGGSFVHVDGTNRAGIARLNFNGSLDLTFIPGGGAVGVNCVAIQPDGKTLVGGAFSIFNGTNMNGIARLNGDTSPTNTFELLTPGLYFGSYLEGTIGNTYRIEWTTNPSTPPPWTPLFDVTLQTDPQLVVDPNPLGGRQRFYRAVLLP